MVADDFMRSLDVLPLWWSIASDGRFCCLEATVSPNVQEQLAFVHAKPQGVGKFNGNFMVSPLRAATDFAKKDRKSSFWLHGQATLAHYRQEIPVGQSREHHFESFPHSTHAWGFDLWVSCPVANWDVVQLNLETRNVSCHSCPHLFLGFPMIQGINSWALLATALSASTVELLRDETSQNLSPTELVNYCEFEPSLTPVSTSQVRAFVKYRGMQAKSKARSKSQGAAWNSTPFLIFT